MMKSNLSIGISGMSCASCVGRVERAIKVLPGVSDSSVNLATERADIVFNTNNTDVAMVISAITTLGYKVATENITLSVQGMNCGSCVSRIEKNLMQSAGVVSASVNLATKRVEAEIVSTALDSAKLVSLIADAGYSAEPIGSKPDRADRERAAREQTLKALHRTVILAIALAFPVFVLEMGSHIFPSIHQWVNSTIGMQNTWYLQFALTTAVLFGPGRVFFTKGIPALIRRSPDMNALVALGTSAAYGYSVIATFMPSVLPASTVNVYFEAAAVIVVLILIGRYLEERARGRTSEAIRRLINLQAKTATVFRDGKSINVNIAQLRVGDIVQIKPGERLPVDGTVQEGESYIDESMISGEPKPVLKAEGAHVIGGTMNTTGAFTFRATKVGDDTALAQIIRMVEQAQGAKLPIQSLLNRVTGVFVPLVMGAAILTFLVWYMLGPDPALSYALVNAVAVLIIACPCAMGLATPTSIMVGTGRAAEIGVLFRKGDALQRLRNTQVVALDKTGTLTMGRPALTDLVVMEGFKEADVLQLVATVERQSEHPVAGAILFAAQSRGLTLLSADNFAAKAGLGVTATVNGHNVAVGADRLMHTLGLDVKAFSATARRLGENAKTPLYVAIDNQLAAIIAVADPIKEGSKTAIETLQSAGLQVVMITGDNQHTAQAIARQLGIDEVVAELMPDGKVKAIQRLQKNLHDKSRQLAFVGDGINDAPALATADVGVAIGTGTDIAIESADVVLMSGDLRGVSNALAISKATMRNIRQNLFWAFAYNAILIPVAAGALYPAFGMLLSPMFAAGAMAASSVCVLGNALRLRRFTPPL